MDAQRTAVAEAITRHERAVVVPRGRRGAALRARLTARRATRRAARFGPAAVGDAFAEREKAWSYVMAAGAAVPWAGPMGVPGLHPSSRRGPGPGGGRGRRLRLGGGASAGPASSPM